MKRNKNKQKPDTDPFILFYFIWPIQNAWESTGNLIKRAWRRVTGAWWCDHCERYHGRRVNKFEYIESIEQVNHLPLNRYAYCSLGRDAAIKRQALTTPANK